jgi:hypothetical protein
MPKWISIFERTPIHHTTYYIKVNGKKKLIPLREFQRHLDNCETFLWLDESDEEKERLQSLINAGSIEEFVKLDYKFVAEQLLTPYDPYIQKSIVLRSFHKYYLNIIADLRKRVSNSGVKSPRIEFKEVKKPNFKKDSLMERIRILNENQYFDINK